jgi:hypothetical protein
MLADGLNPAQNDYPRTGSNDVAEFTSAPPSAPRDYNAGIDSDRYNADYKKDVEVDNRVERRQDTQRQRGDDGEGIPLIGEPLAAAPITSPGEKMHAEDPAKLGISTTTVSDAAAGAAKGALWGLGLGTLAAVATLAVPGFGIVLGGGALAAAIGSMAASAGAGAITGGVVGFLKDQGLPAHDIPAYQKSLEGGGALLAIHVEESISRSEIEEVLKKYGAKVTNSYGYAA